MITVQQIIISFLFFLLLFIKCRDESSEYLLVDSRMKDYRPEVEHYFDSLDVFSNEEKAVLASFNGDYRNAEKYDQYNRLEMNSSIANLNSISNMDQEQKESLRTRILENKSKWNNSKDSVEMKKLLSILTRSKDPEKWLKEYQFANAKDYIISKIDDFQVVAINESHCRFEHRLFVSSLLKDFHNKGFEYLALETLSPEHGRFTESPLYSWGYYSKEAGYNLLIKEALRVGFKLVSYEDTTYSNSSNYIENNREVIQANNIYNQTISKYPKSKILIYAGYHHISEMEDDTFSPMVVQLKKLINQDILTIDQTKMNFYNDIPDNELLAYVYDKTPFQNPVIITDSLGNPVLDDLNALVVDLQVFHPPLKCVNNIPIQFEEKQSQKVRIPSNLLKACDGLIGKVRIKGSTKDNVPIYSIPIDYDSCYLYLPKDSYIFTIYNKNGKSIKDIVFDVN